MCKYRIVVFAFGLEYDKYRGVTAFIPLVIEIYEDMKGQVFVSVLNISLLGKTSGGTVSDLMGKAWKDLNEVINSFTSV